MNLARLHVPARLLTAGLLLIAWFIATNHCAFGLMKPTAQAKAGHSRCCAAGSGSAKDAPAQGGELPCCKALHGTPVPEKAEVKFEAARFQLQFFALLQALVPASAEGDRSSFLFDYGPPRVISFAEAVLQRSLLGHAPPLPA